MNNFGLYLKALRGEKSLREVQRATGISHTYLSTLEKGFDPRTKKPRQPSFEVIEKLSEYYKVPYLELLKKAGYIDDTSNEAMTITEPYFVIEALEKSFNNNELLELLLENNIPYQYNNQYTPEKNEERKLELSNFFSKNLRDLSDLFDSKTDLYYKNRLLTEEEKQKILSIIKTLLN